MVAQVVAVSNSFMLSNGDV